MTLQTPPARLCACCADGHPAPSALLPICAAPHLHCFPSALLPMTRCSLGRRLTAGCTRARCAPQSPTCASSWRSCEREGTCAAATKSNQIKSNQIKPRAMPGGARRRESGGARQDGSTLSFNASRPSEACPLVPPPGGSPVSSLRRLRQSLEPASGPRIPQRRGAGPSSRGRVGERGRIRICDEAGAEAVEVCLEPHAACPISTR